MSALEGPSLHIRGHVLLGDDRELTELWVKDGVVTFTRPSAPGTHQRTIEGWVLPGLVDMHAHVGLGPDGAVGLAEAEEQARAHRRAGVLAVRDAGSPTDTSPLVHRPHLPRIVRAGRHLARPKRYVRGLAVELADAAELPEAVRREARAGDGWVKLVADWIDRDLGADGDLTPLWPDDVLAEAVAVAHGEAARVTAHTFSAEAVPGLLAAGVDCLEHGTGVPPELMGELAERGIPVVPTLLQVAQFDRFAAQADGKYPRFAERMRRLHENRYAHVRALFEAGVPLLVGTDAGTTMEHGRLADECVELVKAGVPASEVVAAASWRARQFLGLGHLVEGAVADLVVYDADPREDIAVLRSPRAVIVAGENPRR
jgi:imidazolonepropionase-like amidohydrolase